MRKQTSVHRTTRARKQKFPRGWDEKRVKEVIAYYDRQTEDEELAEYESAMKLEGQSVMIVPTKLVPKIRRMVELAK